MKPNQDLLTLLTDHAGILQKVSRMYADTRPDREDLRQEIAYQLWKAWPNFRGESKASTWVYRIALKRFRWISIFLRTAGLGIFFGFMMSHLPGLWETPRLWLFGTLLIWVIVSVAINYGVWRKHFRKLEETLAELDE